MFGGKKKKLSRKKLKNLSKLPHIMVIKNNVVFENIFKLVV